MASISTDVASTGAAANVTVPKVSGALDSEYDHGMLKRLQAMEKIRQLLADEDISVPGVCVAGEQASIVPPCSTKSSRAMVFVMQAAITHHPSSPPARAHFSRACWASTCRAERP